MKPGLGLLRDSFTSQIKRLLLTSVARKHERCDVVGLLELRVQDLDDAHRRQESRSACRSSSPAVLVELRVKPVPEHGGDELPADHRCTRSPCAQGRTGRGQRAAAGADNAATACAPRSRTTSATATQTRVGASLDVRVAHRSLTSEQQRPADEQQTSPGREHDHHRQGVDEPVAVPKRDRVGDVEHVERREVPRSPRALRQVEQRDDRMTDEGEGQGAHDGRDGAERARQHHGERHDRRRLRATRRTRPRTAAT